MLTIFTTNLLFAKVIITPLNLEMIQFTLESVSKNFEQTEYSEKYYEIEGVRYPKQILQVEGNLFIQTERRLVEFDIQKRNFISVSSIEENSIVDQEDGRIFICSWENFLIEDPSEYATLIRWGQLSSSEESKEIEVFRTVRPVSCGLSVIKAVNAYDILKPNFYEISVESEEMEIVEEFQIESRAVEVLDGVKDIEEIVVGNDGRVFIKEKVENGLMMRVIMLLGDFNVKNVQVFLKLLPPLSSINQ